MTEFEELLQQYENKLIMVWEKYRSLIMEEKITQEELAEKEDIKQREALRERLVEMAEPKEIHVEMYVDVSSYGADIYMNGEYLWDGSRLEHIFSEEFWETIAQAAGCRVRIDTYEYDSWSVELNDFIANQKESSYDAWMADVAAYVMKKSGLTPDDLADIAYRDMYDDGVSPEEASKRALRNEGFPEDLL